MLMQSSRYSRQSFLGPSAEQSIAECAVGIIGLGGGGSHVVQQLAHIGFQRYVLYDNDSIEDTNLNRLIGGTVADVTAETSKIVIATRMIAGLQPSATIRALPHRWQDRPEELRSCDIVFGCVDSYAQRSELEIECRRYLIHYIDIGMDVHPADPPVIGGQVILSSPGYACMRCIGFLTDDKLAKEAARYGAAGPRPQVVWPNGVLASTAVGIALELVTGWTNARRRTAYLSYDGNAGVVCDSKTLRNVRLDECPHFSLDDIGDPAITAL
jgi:hypothetical protein